MVAKILSAIAPWIHSYSDNVMTKLMNSVTGQTHEKLTSIRYIYHLQKICLKNFTEAFVRNETSSWQSVNRANQVEKIWSSEVFFHFLCKHNAVNCNAMSFTPAQKQARVLVLVTLRQRTARSTGCNGLDLVVKVFFDANSIWIISKSFR